MQDGNMAENATDPTQTPRMRPTGLKIRLGSSVYKELDNFVKEGKLSVRQAQDAAVQDGEVWVLDESRVDADALKKAVEGVGVRAGIEQLGFRDRQIVTGFSMLMQVAGEGARRSGWHKDRPVRQPGEGPNDYAARLRNWQGMKIMLMVSELSEGVEELRKGKAANETYYPTASSGTPIPGKEQHYKPEGLPSELADTVIRILDFCFTEDINLIDMILEKLRFNQTRGQKHGGKAV